MATQPPAADPVTAQLQTADALCAERGQRLTPIRRKVLEAMLRHGRSLKAYELLDMMRSVLPNAAPPTVYRALDFLVAQGLAHRLDAVNAWTACMDAAGDPHDFLVVCTRCGAVAQLSDPALTLQLAAKARAAGFTLARCETELQALCNHCSEQMPETAHSHGHAHENH